MLMHFIVKHLLGVIFMLSTFYLTADCCSSRILLLKEHTLQAVYHHKQQQQQHQHFEHPNNEDYNDSVNNFNGNSADQVIKQNLNKTDLELENIGIVSNLSKTAVQLPPLTPASWPALIKEAVEQLIGRHLLPPPTSMQNSAGTVTDITTNDGTTQGTIDPAQRDKYAGNHVFDFYYTIMRDVLSIECNGQFVTEFCLNGGRCFRYPVANHSFYSCECADGFIGERCESKSLNGELFVPAPLMSSNQKPRILTARVVFSFPMLCAISIIYLVVGAIFVLHKYPQKYPNLNRVAGRLEG